MAKKYNSLKNMSDEEKREYKLNQRRVIQKKYYENHKQELKERYKGKYRYPNIYKTRIDKALEWANTHDIDDCWELLQILKGGK